MQNMLQQSSSHFQVEINMLNFMLNFIYIRTVDISDSSSSDTYIINDYDLPCRNNDEETWIASNHNSSCNCHIQQTVMFTIGSVTNFKTFVKHLKMTYLLLYNGGTSNVLKYK